MSILTDSDTLPQSQVLREDAAESQFGHNQNTSLKAYVHAANLSKELTSKQAMAPSLGEHHSQHLVLRLAGQSCMWWIRCEMKEKPLDLRHLVRAPEGN